MENLNVQAALSQTTAITCKKCGCNVFVPAYLLRKVNKLLVGSEKDMVIPIDTFMCANCHEIDSEFMPSGLDASEENKNTDNGGGSGIIIP